MKRSIWIMALAGLSLTLATVNAWAKNQETRPWTVCGDTIGIVDLSYLSEGYAPWTATDSGQASHLGKYILQAEGINNFVTGKNKGAGRMIAANGDELYFETEAIAETTVVMTVIGGTGRFDGASGSCVMTYIPIVEYDWDNWVMRMTYSYRATGSITY